jgi:glutaredoxin
MKKITLGIALLLISTPLAAAQLYRWVDGQGHVEWRDTPPPSTAKQIEQRNVRANTIDTAGLSYATKKAARDFPATLWTTNCGAACDQARAHLARRGIPYTEKNPQSDLDAYKQLVGGLEVPVLFVGRQQVKGYLESEWDDALDIAGYPRSAASGIPAAVTRAAEPVAQPPAPAQ